MIEIAICEDEPYLAADLSRLVDDYGAARGTAVSSRIFPTGEALLSSRRRADVILMDIKLPGRDGMDVMRRLRDQGGAGQVIFITAYPEYVFQAFELDAVHYIMKPADAERLFPAIDRAVGRAAPKSGRTLLIASGRTASRVPIEDIVYCEALDHQVTIHTLTGEVRFFGTLDAVQKDLDGRFFRCHRSYIVNMDRVAGREPGAATMEDGGKVLIARRKQRDFTQRLLDACRRGTI